MVSGPRAHQILLSVGPSLPHGPSPAFLVFTGLDILRPDLPTRPFLLCSFASLLTGTSWGTAATFGVALPSRAVSAFLPRRRQGLSSGAFRRQAEPRLGPTVLAAVAEVDIMDHIRSPSGPPFQRGPGVAVYAAADPARRGHGQRGHGLTVGPVGPVLPRPRPAPSPLVLWSWHETVSHPGGPVDLVGLALPGPVQGYGPREILCMTPDPGWPRKPAVDELLGRGCSSWREWSPLSARPMFSPASSRLRGRSAGSVPFSERSSSAAAGEGSSSRPLSRG